jgi:type IV secretory pathway VirJ component
MLLPFAGWWPAASAAEQFDLSAGAGLTRLHVARPAGEPRDLVFLISDTSGWTSQLDRSADGLAEAGYAVAGIDLKVWMDASATGSGDCHYVAGDLEEAGKIVQRAWNSKHYRHPILLGVGEGGTVAMLALANAPAETFAGAISLDGTEIVHSKRSLCPPGAGTASGAGAYAYAYAYGRADALAGWFVDARWRRHNPAFPWSQQLANTKSIDLGPVQDLPAALIDAVAASRAFAIDQAEDGRPLSDLPLVELPTDKASPSVALILSGDGGWRDIDKRLASVFVERGLPTIGLDSLRYFWTKRPPSEVAHDLDRIFRHYWEQWGAHQLVLVGYSFGADVLPAVWPLLATETRAAVVQVSLLALGRTAAFEFHVAGWVGLKGSDSRPIPPDLANMDSDRVQCFFGADEKADQTGCRAAEAAGFEQVERPGGHHFDGNYAVIADTILAGLARRSGGAW